MRAHILFTDGDEEVFPIEGFEYKRASGEMIFRVMVEKQEIVRWGLAKNAMVYILNPDGSIYHAYEVRGKSQD